jgi:hypothetical protein
MFPADDVVNFTSPKGVFFVDQAVFANVVGLVGYKTPKSLANRAAHVPEVAEHAI